MEPKFKKKDHIILIQQIELVGNVTIPKKAKGVIKGEGSKLAGHIWYSVDFKDFPQCSPQPVPEHFMGLGRQDSLDLESLKSNPEFIEWLDDHVGQCLKKEMIELSKRALSEDISMVKVSRMTLLTLEEVKAIQSEISA